MTWGLTPSTKRWLTVLKWDYVSILDEIILVQSESLKAKDFMRWKTSKGLLSIHVDDRTGLRDYLQAYWPRGLLSKKL